MQPPTDPPAPSTPVEPGERRRVLDHPPSDRYPNAPIVDPEAGSARRAARALLVALAGAALIAFLGGPLSVTFGLVGLAAVLGWVIGSLSKPSLGLAITLAVGSVALGLVGIWLFARLEGGVLGPTDYFAEVQGPLVIVELAVAALVAAATVR
jgi:hypothetical protein